jgi:hypothetical protein
MSKRVYLLGVGIALLGIALAFTDWVLSLQPGVTERNIKRIRVGMIAAEVDSILGPRVTEPAFILRICGRAMGDGMDVTGDTRAWEGVCGTAVVRFGDDGRVRDFRFFPFQRTKPLARLRSWLGW